MKSVARNPLHRKKRKKKAHRVVHISGRMKQEKKKKVTTWQEGRPLKAEKMEQRKRVADQEVWTGKGKRGKKGSKQAALVKGSTIRPGDITFLKERKRPRRGKKGGEETGRKRVSSRNPGKRKRGGGTGAIKRWAVSDQISIKSEREGKDREDRLAKRRRRNRGESRTFRVELHPSENRRRHQPTE